MQASRHSDAGLAGAAVVAHLAAALVRGHACAVGTAAGPPVADGHQAARALPARHAEYAAVRVADVAVLLLQQLGVTLGPRLPAVPTIDDRHTIGSAMAMPS